MRALAGVDPEGLSRPELYLHRGEEANAAELLSFPGKLGNFMDNSGVCFSRSLFHKAGGIDHRLHYGEDLELWRRIALAGGRDQGHDGMVNVAIHPGNNELAVGEDRRLEEAVALAFDRGQRQWL